MKELYNDIVNKISIIILKELDNVSSEQRYPSSDPDRMDDIIKDGKLMIVQLRKLRNDFEDIVTGVIN